MSSIDNPAFSTVFLMPSIARRASCSASAGTCPVLGSVPMCPAIYRVLPTRTPSLKGKALESAGLGFTMYLRSAPLAATEKIKNRTATAHLCSAINLLHLELRSSTDSGQEQSGNPATKHHPCRSYLPPQQYNQRSNR